MNNVSGYSPCPIYGQILSVKSQMLFYGSFLLCAPGAVNIMHNVMTTWSRGNMRQEVSQNRDMKKMAYQIGPSSCSIVCNIMCSL